MGSGKAPRLRRDAFPDRSTRLNREEGWCHDGAPLSGPTHDPTPRRCLVEWVKLYAVPAYYHDPALLRAGEAAEVLFCRALAHCGQVESGGRVDKTVLPLLVPKAQPRADALVREGLWLDEGTHYRVRSWERLQDEHDAAAERKKRDRERKRQARAAAQSGDRPADASTGQSADSPRTSPGRGAESPPLEGEGEGDREGQPPTAVAAAGKPPTRATRIPEVFPFDDEHAEHLWRWAQEHTPAVAIGPETENWRDWHLAKGDTAKDWTASWRTWMRRAQKDTERGGGRGPARVSTTDQRVQAGLSLVEKYQREGA